jgi:hypothetical protein
VQNNDDLGAIVFDGDDGSLFTVAASIVGSVDGTPGANNMPGRLVFSTTANGASVPTERMRITANGNIGIGTTSPSANLHVVGNAIISTALSVGTINVAPAIGAAFDKANAANVLAFTSGNEAEGAFLRSNVTFVHANAAFFQANQAFADANTAEAWAAAAFLRGNVAFSQANQAFAVANTSGAEAEGAFLRSNVTFVHANAAFLQANQAFAKANAANVLAYNASLSTVKATNLDGGATGQIAYQTAADTTDFLSAGTYGKVLKSSGSGVAPIWDTVPTYADSYTLFGTSGISGTATEVSGLNATYVEYAVPTWARKITILLNQLAPDGTGNDIGIRLGDSGGIETTGYVAGSAILTGGIGNYHATFTNGFFINAYTYGITYTGSIVLTRMGGETTWICSGVLTDDGTGTMMLISGRKTLSGNITTVRILAEGGTTFDILGGFSVAYE